MGLGAEVVDFGGLDLRENIDEIGAVREIAVMKLELGWPCKGMIRLDGVLNT